jgi:hypothetical protein
MTHHAESTAAGFSSGLVKTAQFVMAVLARAAHMGTQ